MRPMTLILFITAGFINLLHPAILFARDAPVTSAGSSAICPGMMAIVPVTVINFTSIGAITLRMDYDPTQLAFDSYSNLNTSISGAAINHVTISTTQAKILIVWASINGLTLPDNSKLLDLNFTLITGSPGISFNNIASGGGECEYADENGVTLNDIPSETFYINSAVGNLGAGAADTLTGADSLCAGTGNVAYSVPPVVNATGYIWEVPPGCTIVAGENSPSIIVNYAPTAASGNITAAGTNDCGTGSASVLPVTVFALPAPAIIGEDTVCAASTGNLYSTEAGMNNYLWAVSPGGSITSGSGTNMIEVTWIVNGTQSVSIAYTNENGCDASVPATKNITVVPLPGTSGDIYGPAIVCAGTPDIIYSVPAISDASSYHWTVPPGAEITSCTTTNLITVHFGVSPGTGAISVNGINACGSGPVSPDFMVTMLDPQNMPVVTAEGPLLTSSIPVGNQWYYEGTGAIAGATGQTYTATTTGWYWSVAQGEGCPILESNHVYVLFTGQDEIQHTIFSAYPVPGDGRFNVLITASLQGTYTILVYNQLGEKVYECCDFPASGTTEKQVDLRPAAAGIYSVMLITSGHKAMRKVLVK